MIITDYTIVEEPDVITLRLSVEKAMKAGWQPFGAAGHTFTPNQNQSWHQTLIKTVSEPQ